MFNAGINKPSGQKPYMQGTLNDVFAVMNTPQIAQLTRELRALKDEKQQKLFKAEKLPFVTFSGQFSYRNTKGLIAHSGLMCFDFDHLPNDADVQRVRRVLLGDPTFATELMFTSPRGNGVKWITHIDLERGDHAKWYRAIRQYLLYNYGIEADPAPSSVCSACFLCWDADLVINKEICVF